MRILIATLLLTGCAALGNTPAQERTAKAAELCRALLPADSYVSRISPDGRIYVQGTTGTGNFGPFFDCIRAGGPRP
jgi:hypothetical protein